MLHITAIGTKYMSALNGCLLVSRVFHARVCVPVFRLNTETMKGRSSLVPGQRHEGLENKLVLNGISLWARTGAKLAGPLVRSLQRCMY